MDAWKGRKKLIIAGSRSKTRNSSSPYPDYYNDAVISALYAAANKKIDDWCRSLDVQPLVIVLLHFSFIYVAREEEK
jgi:hypothetical protein